MSLKGHLIASGAGTISPFVEQITNQRQQLEIRVSDEMRDERLKAT